jgi:hypothetical protein
VVELWSEEGNQGRIRKTKEEANVEVGEMEMEEDGEMVGGTVRAEGPTKN